MPARQPISLPIALRRAIIACELLSESYNPPDEPGLSISPDWNQAASTIREFLNSNPQPRKQRDGV